MSEPVLISVFGTNILFVGAKGDDSTAMLKHEFESSDNYGLNRISKSGLGLMVDIGANIGAISIYASKRNPEWHIYSFEPIPTTYFYLRYNMFMNNITALHRHIDDCNTITHQHIISTRMSNQGGISAFNCGVGLS